MKCIPPHIHPMSSSIQTWPWGTITRKRKTINVIVVIRQGRCHPPVATTTTNRRSNGWPSEPPLPVVTANHLLGSGRDGRRSSRGPCVGRRGRRGRNGGRRTEIHEFRRGGYPVGTEWTLTAGRGQRRGDGGINVHAWRTWRWTSWVCVKEVGLYALIARPTCMMKGNIIALALLYYLLLLLLLLLLLFCFFRMNVTCNYYFFCSNLIYTLSVYLLHNNNNNNNNNTCTCINNELHRSLYISLQIWHRLWAAVPCWFVPLCCSSVMINEVFSAMRSPPPLPTIK